MTQKAKFCTVKIPPHEQGPLTMEQILATLHGIKEPVSFEWWGQKHQIFLGYYAKRHRLIRDLLQNHYPGIDVQRKDKDITTNLGNTLVHICHLKLTSCDIWPIRRYSQATNWLKREWVNPAQTILPALRCSHQEIRGVQIIFRPAPLGWHKKSMDTLAIYNKISSWFLLERLQRFSGWLIRLIHRCWWLRTVFILIARSQPQKTYGDQEKIDHRQHARESASDAAQSKLSQIAFEVSIRLIYCGNKERANSVLTEIASSFAPFSVPELNEFCSSTIQYDQKNTDNIVHRRVNQPMILSVEELAGILAFPSQKDIKEIPEVQKTSYKKLVRHFPATKAGVVVGKSMRGKPLHIQPHHTAIVGKSGVGKSTLAKTMILDTIRKNGGLCVLDPHGDLIESVINAIPVHRVSDVVLFDPNDTDYPIAFNILQGHSKSYQVASAITDVFQKLFEKSWGPRSEHLLRNALLCLSQCPKQSLLGINRLFLDKRFRKDCLKYIANNPICYNFWNQEFETLSKKQQRDSYDPLLNKIGRFLVPELVNILGQSENLLNFREIIDTQKILLVNLAKGTLGATNSALLGSLILSHLQLAAMSRADTHKSSRKRFDIYVDEVQNFAITSGDTLKTFLSETRKYQVFVSVIFQHLSQLGRELTDSILANTTNLFVYNLSYQDAVAVEPYIPDIHRDDFINLPKFHGYLRTLSNHGPPEVISFQNIVDNADKSRNCKQQIIASSRKKYSRHKADVEDEIITFWEKIHTTNIP